MLRRGRRRVFGPGPADPADEVCLALGASAPTVEPFALKEFKIRQPVPLR